MINNAQDLTDLRIPPANHLEKLAGTLAGFHSIRINQQWRIILIWARTRQFIKLRSNFEVVIEQRHIPSLFQPFKVIMVSKMGLCATVERILHVIINSLQNLSLSQTCGKAYHELMYLFPDHPTPKT